MTALPKSPPIVSSPIRNLPKREPIACTLNLFGCRELPEYTVLAHLRGFWALGASQKPNDHFGVYACDRCHDVLDRRSSHAEHPGGATILAALYCSQQLMIRHGVLSVKGAK